MLRAANTELLHPLVPNAHNSECVILVFSLRINEKSQLKLFCGFLFLAHSALKG